MSSNEALLPPKAWVEKRSWHLVNHYCWLEFVKSFI